MDSGFQDLLRLVHPTLAIAIVFPIIGIAVFLAWQTRQRRLQVGSDGKSKIPPVVGQEHLKIGRLLAGAVVGIELLGITRPLFSKISADQVWAKDPTKVILIVLIYGVVIGSLVVLYRAREKVWRAVFATLAGTALVVLSFQDGIYRRDNEWYISHFYFGVTAALLMIFSLAIIQDIYQDRSNRWRIIHTVLNSIAVLLFFGQAFTGTRDLLEIPLSWQEPFIYQCDFTNKTCPQPAPAKQSQALDSIHKMAS